MNKKILKIELMFSDIEELHWKECTSIDECEGCPHKNVQHEICNNDFVEDAEKLYFNNDLSNEEYNEVNKCSKIEELRKVLLNIGLNHYRNEV